MEVLPVDSEIQRFREHLESNKRIILSAKFGDGKTYFLNEVKKQLSAEYYFITLYPVNYSVAPNEDIFEYIKRDILSQLDKDEKLDRIDVESMLSTIATWENVKSILYPLLEVSPMGKLVAKILDKCKDMKDDYDSRKSTFEKYDLHFREQRGGLYEEDGYTKLIEHALHGIRVPQNQKDERKPILIIEDLDRVDPAHLFRILNVLGAHIDENAQTNKFGFENIVVVMDYDATEHIFHHFYGEKANYSGYISKFMSHYPFKYSIKQLAKDYLYKYFKDKCLFEKDEVDQMMLGLRQSVRYVMDLKSVRDIVQVIDDVEQQMITTPIELRNGTMVNPDNPIVRLLIITRRMGISQNELIRVLRLIHEKDITRYFQIMGDLILNDISVIHKGVYSCVCNGADLLLNISQEGQFMHCKYVLERAIGYRPANTRQLTWRGDYLGELADRAYELAKKYVKDLDLN